MINLPDFDVLTNSFIHSNVIRETHLGVEFKKAIMLGFALGIKHSNEEVKIVNEKITNKRKNNISC